MLHTSESVLILAEEGSSLRLTESVSPSQESSKNSGPAFSVMWSEIDSTARIPF